MYQIHKKINKIINYFKIELYNQRNKILICMGKLKNINKNRGNYWNKYNNYNNKY